MRGSVIVAGFLFFSFLVLFLSLWDVGTDIDPEHARNVSFGGRWGSFVLVLAWLEIVDVPGGGGFLCQQVFTFHVTTSSVSLR